MEMSYLTLKLRALKLDLHEDLLVHRILISLPVQFNYFKLSVRSKIDAPHVFFESRFIVR